MFVFSFALNAYFGFFYQRTGYCHSSRRRPAAAVCAVHGLSAAWSHCVDMLRLDCMAAIVDWVGSLCPL
jgi:hypothetical protein